MTDEEIAAKEASDAAAKVAQEASDTAGYTDKLGEPGLKALQAEREARAKAEKDLTDARAALQKIEDAKLSDIERAQKERDEQAAENARLKSANARLAALATHPVPKDYQDLVTGTDEESYLASAKKISELYARAEGKGNKPGPVHDSGSRSGESKTSGGSLSAGREAFAAKHNQKKEG